MREEGRLQLILACSVLRCLGWSDSIEGYSSVEYASQSKEMRRARRRCSAVERVSVTARD